MRYFFDMDGVLCKFMHGTPFEAIYEKGYFRNLPPQGNIVNAAKELIKTNEVYVLSSVLDDHSTSKEEKNAWLKEHFPELPANHILFVICGTNKAEIDIFDPNTDILIDDYGINCKKWSDKGGQYIKVAKNNLDIEKEKEKHEFVISPEMNKSTILELIRQTSN